MKNLCVGLYWRPELVKHVGTIGILLAKDSNDPSSSNPTQDLDSFSETMRDTSTDSGLRVAHFPPTGPGSHLF